ncbi:hypothetical protein BZL39_K05300 [Zygosaccharomyces parabailii]|nr:hypothetical protein BZL39_K05300 [Zygosaccharomyces parabailii]
MSSVSTSPSDHDILTAALAFTKNVPLASAKIRRLESPIAIPQTAPGLGKSFTRAWAPILQNHDITMQDFVTFIDNLNVLSAESPPLQALDVAGGVIGMVPHHWPMLAGLAIQSTAKVCNAVVSKGRTELYMREVNGAVFEPRSLKVSIASTSTMRDTLRVPINLPILAPLTADTMRLSTVERVLIELEPYNAALDFNVPPPTEQTTVLAKLSAKQVAAQEKKEYKKVLKHREKVVRKENREERREERRVIRREGREERREERRAIWNLQGERGREREEKRALRRVEKEREKEERKSTRNWSKPSREEKDAEKLVWIIIESL